MPNTWGEFNLTERLQIQAADPQLEAVLSGAMPPDLELQVLTGKLPTEAEPVITEQQQRQQAIEAWNQAHPVLDPIEAAKALQQQVAERRAAGEQARQLSAEMAARALQATSRAARSW